MRLKRPDNQMQGVILDFEKKKVRKDIIGATGKPKYKLLLKSVSVSVWNFSRMITTL